MDDVLRIMYHTQEDRGTILNAPVPTHRNDAWLGTGIYFWYHEQDGIWWGITAKNKTGKYQVYRADVLFDNILDTVFNEEHYLFWIEQIEKAIKKYYKGKKKETLSLRYINDYFRDNNLYDGINGVLFQDITSNPDFWVIDKFQYKKRIQLAVFNSQIVSNFALHYSAECSKK